jgi:hypothetical protein
MAAVYEWNTKASKWVHREGAFRTELDDNGLGVDVVLSADGSTLAIATRGSNEMADTTLDTTDGTTEYSLNPSYVNIYTWNIENVDWILAASFAYMM